MFGCNLVKWSFFLFLALFFKNLEARESQPNVMVLEINKTNSFSNIQYQAADSDFDEIVQRSEGWKNVGTGIFDAGFSSKTYWLKQELSNPTENNEWFLTLDNTRLDFVDFYLLTAGELQHLSSGDHRPISGQLSSNPTFRFYLPSQKSAHLYVRVQSGAKLDFLPIIRGSLVYGQYSSLVKTTHIFYALILLAFVALPILINKQITDKITLYYVASLGCGFACNFFYFGEGNLLLWPDNTLIKNHNLFIFAMLSCALFSLFLQEYLRSSSTMPRLYYLLKGYVAFVFISIVITLFPVDNIVRIVLVLLVVTGLVFLTALGIIQAVKRDNYWVLWLATPLIFTMIATFVYVCSFLGLLPYIRLTFKFVLWSFFFDVLLISLSLIFRHYALRHERNELLVKLDDISKQQNDISTDVSSDIARLDSNNRLGNINNHATIVKLDQYLDQDKAFLNPGLSVESVASVIDIRPDQLSALINIELNTSFPTLINIRRLNTAASLLKNNQNKHILNVALECGFNSKSNFNRLFKEYFGTTPTLYRKSFISLSHVPEND